MRNALRGTLAGKVTLSTVWDHPLISRYPGSYIRQYVYKEFDEFNLPVAAGSRKNAGKTLGVGVQFDCYEVVPTARVPGKSGLLTASPRS